MFGCYLYKIDDACDTVFGSNPDSLCSGKVKMSECKTVGP